MKKVIEGSHAITEAVKLCEPKVIASYPITPQTHIAERLSEMIANGEWKCRFLNVESEHSAMSACIGAQATGVRTFTATASQGLALMHEMLYVASGMRLPIVMAVANRSLSAPLNIWCDWSDSISERDTGWLQFYCENAQEAFDTTIQAYKIAEQVQLPAMVCIDGFILSHVYEPVVIEDKKKVDTFLPKYSGRILDFDKPVSQGEWAGPDYFQEFKKQQQEAIDGSRDLIKKTNDDFGKMFGRKYGNGLIETYNMEHAKYGIITMGSICGTIKHLIATEKIKDIGLIRLRSFRPFPHDDLKKAISGLTSVGVFEKDISLGMGGALWSEVNGIADIPVSNFIGGLGGRDTTLQDLKKVFETIKKKREDVNWV